MAALSIVKLCVLQVLVEYLLISAPPPPFFFLILSFYALYLQLPFIDFFSARQEGFIFIYLSPFSSPSGEICWILPWCFVSMDLWAISPKFWCVLTCCNNSQWLITLNVSGVCIKSWVLFCCVPHLLSVCLGSSVISLPFLERMSSPEYHGLQLNQTSLHQVFCCVVNSVTCMTERVYSRSCSVIMYIRNLQLNLCTDFALVAPHVIFSALVNKKKGKFILMWEIIYCNHKYYLT